MNAPQRGRPDVADPPQHLSLPPLHPMQAHGKSFYMETIRYLNEVGMKFFGGKANAIAADNWRKKLERNFGNVSCSQEYCKELTVQYLKHDATVWWDKM